MEHDLQQHKDPSPKTIVDACRFLAGWKNKYGTRVNKMTNANDVMAFTKTSEEDNNKKNKKKEITCYKCKKTGHQVNECDEEKTIKTSNKKGSSFLVIKMTNMTVVQMRKSTNKMKSVTRTIYM